MDGVNSDVLSLIKDISICLSSYLIYLYLSNLSSLSNKLRKFINAILMTICFCIINMVIRIEPLNILLILITISFISAKINKYRFIDIFIYMLISISIASTLYFICAFITSIITVLLSSIIAFSFIQAIISDLLLILITVIISKHLYMPKPHENKSCIINIFLSCVIYIFHSLVEYEVLLSDSSTVIVIIGECLCLLILILVLRNTRAALFNKTVYISSLKHQKKEYEELQLSHDDLATKVHRDNKFLLSLYSAVETLANDSLDSKTKQEAKVLLSELGDIRADKSYGSIYDADIKSTDIVVINALFHFMIFIAQRNGIEIKIRPDPSIKGILDFITLGYLETLIADLIENAINAVMECSNKKRKISVFLGFTGGYYKISVTDNGVPFSKATLDVLGKEKVTTRIAGSGIGYMTIFKILQESKASLYIDQTSQDNKTITVLFDSKNKFIVI